MKLCVVYDFCLIIKSLYEMKVTFGMSERVQERLIYKENSAIGSYINGCKGFWGWIWERPDDGWLGFGNIDVARDWRG